MSHKSELPQHLIEAFWEEVRAEVEQTCRVTEKQARTATARFRKKIETKVGDMIYHDNVQDVAQTIAFGIFWEQVRRRLLGRWGMTTAAADRALAAFVAFAEKRGFKKSILDHDTDDVAENIAAGVANGFREPASA